MPNAKYIIAKNVKNPFQMRATSPLNVDAIENNTASDLAIVEAKNVPDFVPTQSVGTGVDAASFGAFGQISASPTEKPVKDLPKKEEVKVEAPKEEVKVEAPKEKKSVKKTVLELGKDFMAQTAAPEAMTQATQNIGGTGNYKKYRNIPTPLPYVDPDSPLKYSTPNPFPPRSQSVINNVFTPNNDIDKFVAARRITKDPTTVRLGDAQMDPTIIDPNPNTIDLNPNTYNQPAIPTEQDMTMTDLETGNQPLDPFGDDLSGGMIPSVGLPPGQGMGSTQSGGVTPNPTIDTRRQQNKLRRQTNRADKKAKRISDREYRRTGERPSLFGS